jgi:hypothetical protein
VLNPDIRAVDEHVYAVGVTRDDDRTLSEHTVRVPDDLIASWGTGLTEEPPLVRAAMELLVQRHGAALPAEFSLTDPAVAYDGFLDELRLRLTVSP